MRSPRYTILVANRRTGAVRRLTFSRRPAILAVLGVLAVPVLMGLGARRAGQAEIGALQTFNDNLRLENESYRAATAEMIDQIASLQTALVHLGEQAQLDPAAREALDKLPAIVRARAMGGARSAEPEPRPAAAPASPESTFDVLRDLLGVLEDRLTTVRTRIENRQALAAATPSIWPVTGWLSSGFGQRRDPFTGQPDFHAGLDISADRGTPVRATADGVVESAGVNGNYGKSVLLNHGFGISTRYGHLSSFAVLAGQRVRRGEVIGYVGATGRATSSHLHYEILLNNQTINPLRLLARP